MKKCIVCGSRKIDIKYKSYQAYKTIAEIIEAFEKNNIKKGMSILECTCRKCGYESIKYLQGF